MVAAADFLDTQHWLIRAVKWNCLAQTLYTVSGLGVRYGTFGTIERGSIQFGAEEGPMFLHYYMTTPLFTMLKSPNKHNVNLQPFRSLKHLLQWDLCTQFLRKTHSEWFVWATKDTNFMKVSTLFFNTPSFHSILVAELAEKVKELR